MFESSSATLDIYQRRREKIFILFAGLFLGSLAMLNILGISRLIDLSFSIFGVEIPFRVFIGVLPYPITFLCTDFISEFYGKKRANMVVWMGLVINIWVLFIIWLGGELPPETKILESTGLPDVNDQNYVYYRIRMLAFGATAASMAAYLTAQFVDVHVFHFLKKLTKGRHLWLRNNGSTLTSQMVDSVAVVLITYYWANAIAIPEDESVTKTLTILILSNYIFKMTVAFIDTLPFYWGVKYLGRYLKMDPNQQFKKDKYE